VLVLLEGDVPAHHVVEEDAKGPDGQRVGGVTSETDPLRRGVDASSIEIGVVGLRCGGMRSPCARSAERNS